MVAMGREEYAYSRSKLAKTAVEIGQGLEQSDESAYLLDMLQQPICPLELQLSLVKRLAEITGEDPEDLGLSVEPDNQLNRWQLAAWVGAYHRH